ncbi:MAG: acyl carrier protein [Candidatus Binatia bacterium]
MLNREIVLSKVRSALASVLADNHDAVRGGDHLVDDLGLDSTNMASLTIALEEEFDDVLLLNDWIAEAHSPSELTVDSLVDYLLAMLAEPG